MAWALQREIHLSAHTDALFLPRFSYRAWLLGVLLLTFGCPRFATAAPGDVDPSFGVAGKVESPYEQRSQEILALAIQADGKIIAVGSFWPSGGAQSFLVARYNVDGSLDATFGSNGKTISQFASTGSSAHAVAIQSDGKIVAAGSAGDLFVLVRYTADGNLDQNFANVGVITGSFESYGPNLVSIATSVAVQSDGKIIVAGDSLIRDSLSPGEFSDSNFGLARYNDDGRLDETFGSGGTVVTDFGRFDRAEGVVLQTDGKIVVAGDSHFLIGNYIVSDAYSLVLARYNSNGTLDETFGSGGKAATDNRAFETSAVSIQTDGKIVVAGSTSTDSLSSSDFALARYNSDGSIDSSFGSNGRVFTNVGTSPFVGRAGDDRAFALGIQPDGKFVVAGSAQNGYGSSDFAVVRYESSGSLDETFGNGGKVITEVFAIGWSTFDLSSTFPGGICACFTWVGPPPDEQAFALAIQPDGKIIAGGVTGIPTGGSSSALVRYHGLATPKLTVATSGTAGGITSADSAISCGTRCSASYDAGSAVTLTALPLDGSFFAGWNGCPEPNGSNCTVVLNQETLVTAIFAMHTLTVTKSGTGTGLVYSQGVINCGSNCSASVGVASEIKLTAVPAAGSYLVGWNGCQPVMMGDICSVVLDGDTVVAAVFELDLPLAVSPVVLANAEVGVPYAAATAIIGGRLPLTTKVLKGALPSGLAFDLRSLGGTPLKAGKSNFSVRITDAAGKSIVASFRLTVVKGLSITTKSLKAGRIGKNYRVSLKASGGKAPYGWSLVSGSLPAGVSLDGFTGKISGVPTKTGSFNFTVRLTDPLGGTVDNTFTLVII
jgi:uncharacterized delta-60 repeat protein